MSDEDAESPGYYDEMYESDSDDSQEADLGDNFFDIEASESDGEPDETGHIDDVDNVDHWAMESESSERSDDKLHRWTKRPPFRSDYSPYHRSFTLFSRLPPELRHYIWTLFCPDLTAKSRLFEFRIVSTTGPPWIGAFLEQQTAPARAVLATNRESRALALRALPDTLPAGQNPGVIRFNKARDIVFLSCHRLSYLGSLPPSFSDKIKYLAMEVEHLGDGNGSVEDHSDTDSDLDDGLDLVTIARPVEKFLGSMPNLDTFYLCSTEWIYEASKMTWFESEKIHTYRLCLFEEQPGLGEDADFIYCWPDRPRSDDSASERSSDGEQSYGRLEVFGAKTSCRTHIKLLPMVRFEFLGGQEHYEDLMDWKQSKGGREYPLNSVSSDVGSETNEYESEGIDDSEVESDQDQSSDENDILVMPLSQQEPDRSESETDTGDDGSETIDAEPDSSDGQSAASDESSDGSDQPGILGPPAGADYPVAEFSSPDPSPSPDTQAAAVKSSSGSPDAGSLAPGRVRLTTRNKRHIVPSDSETSSDAELTKDVARPAKRSRRVVLSDSEDSDDTG